MKRRLLTIVLTLLLTMGLTALPVLAAGIGSGNTLCTDSANCVKSQEDIDALNSKLNLYIMYYHFLFLLPAPAMP